MNHLVLPNRAIFVCDTHVNENPTAEQLAEIAVMASDVVRRFGIEPKVAMLSHSNFGASSSESARKMAHATALFHALAPETEADGEMHGDGALSEEIRSKFDLESPLTGEANILVMPNLDAANISYSLLKMVAGNGVTIGPILLGAARPVQVLTTTATVRRIVNMTALTVVDVASR
jgi:malate dehydrogenase (oxaloacetate-decarboxylating)(NADP+)